MTMYDILTRKKQGLELSREEIRYFVSGYTEGSIPDYQAAAFTMAVCLCGMTDRETTDLTVAMAESGETADLSLFGELSVDKHSTGGVGDKTTLIVAPIVASLGAKVAKMSGRGLGHTGGTVDKLESFPGYDTALSPEAFREQVKKIGIAVIGQSGNFAPADKKLYALRDVTATVDSIPLITSSIMSKKLAAGTHSIVLDVKFGSGAFMTTPEAAEELAYGMVKIGTAAGRKVSALITNMDRPLGRAVGNILEVKEALEVLSGAGPDDLKTVCLALASEMVSHALGKSESEAAAMCNEALTSGKALEKFREWIGMQGGDTMYVDNPDAFPTARYSHDVLSDTDGYLTYMDTERIGTASVILGAGRATKTDEIDHAAGIIINKKTGDFVTRGEVIATLLTSNEETLAAAAKTYLGAIDVGPEPPRLEPLIYKTVRI
ncbi:MAG: thymidine phosphorylase [Clostridia bacterium]|nr:thymidine phosphorylase [Clostridia bacterium]